MSRPQFRLSTLLWITLAVACWFGGRAFGLRESDRRVKASRDALEKAQRGMEADRQAYQLKHRLLLDRLVEATGAGSDWEAINGDNRVAPDRASLPNRPPTD